MNWEKNNTVSEEEEVRWMGCSTGGKETGGTGEYSSGVHRP